MAEFLREFAAPGASALGVRKVESGLLLRGGESRRLPGWRRPEHVRFALSFQVSSNGAGQTDLRGFSGVGECVHIRQGEPVAVADQSPEDGQRGPSGRNRSLSPFRVQHGVGMKRFPHAERAPVGAGAVSDDIERPRNEPVEDLVPPLGEPEPLRVVLPDEDRLPWGVQAAHGVGEIEGLAGDEER